MVTIQKTAITGGRTLGDNGGEVMKLMIAYDGSTYADAAIDDLVRAGLPDNAEALVVSVADPTAARTTVSEFDLISAATRRIDSVLAHAKIQRKQGWEWTERIAANAVETIHARFPDWVIRSEVLDGDPADALLDKANQWRPDLLVMGSQGRSAVGRFFLGSVSKSVAESASCSVRVARAGFARAEGEPSKIMLAAKDPSAAELVVESLGRRIWPSGTEVSLIAVDDGVSAHRVSAFYADGKAIYEQILERLAHTDVSASVKLVSGDPKAIVLEAAETRRPNAIFMAGEAADDAALDETATSLITSAKCTVEIVR